MYLVGDQFPCGLDVLVRVSYVDILEYAQGKLVSKFENIIDFIAVLAIFVAYERAVWAPTAYNIL
jgi:hypothetical protein